MLLEEPGNGLMGCRVPLGQLELVLAPGHGASQFKELWLQASVFESGRGIAKPGQGSLGWRLVLPASHTATCSGSVAGGGLGWTDG